MKILEKYGDSIRFATENGEYWIDFDRSQLIDELPNRIEYVRDYMKGSVEMHDRLWRKPTWEDVDEQILINFINNNKQYWEKAE